MPTVKKSQSKPRGPSLKEKNAKLNRENNELRRELQAAQPRPHRSAGAADRHERDTARDRQLADKPSACARYNGGNCREAL